MAAKEMITKMHVWTDKAEERREMLAFLEEKGFVSDKDEFRSKEEIISTFLPIVVNVVERNYRMMGNVTCAAAAASKGCMFTKDEFYERYKQLWI